MKLPSYLNVGYPSMGMISEVMKWLLGDWVGGAQGGGGAPGEHFVLSIMVSSCHHRVAPNSEFDRMPNIFVHEEFPNTEYRIVFVHECFPNTE